MAIEVGNDDPVSDAVDELVTPVPCTKFVDEPAVLVEAAGPVYDDDVTVLGIDVGTEPIFEAVDCVTKTVLTIPFDVELPVGLFVVALVTVAPIPLIVLLVSIDVDREPVFDRVDCAIEAALNIELVVALAVAVALVPETPIVLLPV